MDKKKQAHSAHNIYVYIFYISYCLKRFKL